VCTKPKTKTQFSPENMKTKQLVAMAVTALVISLGAGSALAQNNNNQDNNNNGGGRRNRGNGGGNFDPAQFQQRMMDNYKEQLEITDDTEWNAIKPLIEKVSTAQRNIMADRARGMFGGRNRGGGGGGNDNGGGNGGGGGGNRFGGTPSAEAESLRKAIDSKASNSELKTAIAKFVESRKTKQADLEKAQADLRKVLSVRQEAIATQIGLL
jgi:hypothetical protein